MTETELKQGLSADVADVQAPPDLLARARSGGARRVRRRRFVAVGAVTLTAAVVGGVAVAGPTVLDHSSDAPVAAVSGDSDPYAFLMKGPTRGDLAGDRTYLREVLAVWHSSHSRSANNDRGIFDRMQGDAKVAWAGHTPAGRAAIVVENSDLRNHENVQLYHEGVATLVGYLGDGPDGQPMLIGDDYPVRGATQQAAFLVGQKRSLAMVVLQMPGKPIGWSAGRTYADDGSVERTYTELKFQNQVSVVPLPAGQNLSDLRINRIPGNEFSRLSIVNAGVNASPPETSGDKRLWADFPPDADTLWPLTDGADKLRTAAGDTFNEAIRAIGDPNAYGTAMSLWTGYGVTANGTAVYLGEQQLDNDPTHVYAVLKPKTGKATVVHGGAPDRSAVLPVAIKLPDGQGWAVARKDARLSYRYDGGAWSPARPNALLVPAGSHAEVLVQVGGRTSVVPLP